VTVRRRAGLHGRLFDKLLANPHIESTTTSDRGRVCPRRPESLLCRACNVSFAGSYPSPADAFPDVAVNLLSGSLPSPRGSCLCLCDDGLAKVNRYGSFTSTRCHSYCVLQVETPRPLKKGLLISSGHEVACRCERAPGDSRHTVLLTLPQKVQIASRRDHRPPVTYVHPPECMVA
jgi:hypothetical protein